ncbi:glycine/D-amino acid oxidase-like deaminating enzyme [Gillisia mitskevichiae]|uniref:Glycine/D-amino acid oxidase-like deaminating enzyme n=1 Tax=Gillisia mitskevichiae TaxID=270921 RepID=A0A495PYF2_9FLAO|nr:FAD-dependent oxidoreductase [Gillisia mitskevichiae]RKS55339.1 glycine/D-amino acid oxidase-like deaminating enzyme [Gillisia mitskevichiae]
MNLSYWEHQSWLSNVDHTIVGSGIVGLNTALRLREKFPKANILILERGFLPNGASTKNAGFACFGSLSEILDDLNSHSEEEVVQLVQKRVDGLALLRTTLGNEAIDFKLWGGYELFTPQDKALLEDCESKMEYVNKLLFPVFKENVFSSVPDKFNFKKIEETLIFNKFEGQINTGRMMEALLQKALSAGIKILNNITVQEFSEVNSGVKIKTDQFEFSTKKLFIATNGFAAQLGMDSVKPARAQVLITKPIENLQIQGTFHLDKGFYYFRNIDKRILLGGGRNLDIKTEETTNLGETELIQNKLEELLRETILPNIDFEIDRRWSGIMGVGVQKKPIVKRLSSNTFCGVRLGGMGVAIGSLVGKELADLIPH